MFQLRIITVCGCWSWGRILLMHIDAWAKFWIYLDLEVLLMHGLEHLQCKSIHSPCKPGLQACKGSSLKFSSPGTIRLLLKALSGLKLCVKYNILVFLNKMFSKNFELSFKKFQNFCEINKLKKKKEFYSTLKSHVTSKEK